jgi:hypothetical protein
MGNERGNEEREQIENNDKEEAAVAAVSVSALDPEERATFQAEIARQVMQELPLEAKVQLASEAAGQLPRAEQDKLIRGLQALSPEERREIGGLLLPEQRTTNQIWLIIVGSFAFVLTLSVVALCVGVLWRASGEIQTLLTVVTTVAGILAGFVSGRASAGGTSSAGDTSL